MSIRVRPVRYASVSTDFPATLHENEPGRCTMQPARWISENSGMSNNVREPEQGKERLCRQHFPVSTEGPVFGSVEP